MRTHPFSFFKTLQKSTVASDSVLAKPWDISSGASLLVRWSHDSGFPTVECLPASITIVEDKTLSETLVSELSSQKPQGNIRFRFQDREVLLSEFHPVGLSHSQWRQTTFHGAALAAGVPERFIPELADHIGLLDKLHSSLAQSDISERKRFAVCCAFFAKKHFVLLDKPFEHIEPAWEPTIANLILEAALITKKIFVVTHLTHVPSSWRGNAVVRWQSENQIIKDSASTRIKVIRGMLTNVTRNSQAVKQLSDRYIYTRPQTIAKPPMRSGVEETMSREQIENPNSTPVENEE